MLGATFACLLVFLFILWPSFVYCVTACSLHIIITIIIIIIPRSIFMVLSS